MPNTRSRKYLLTINNPIDNNSSHMVLNSTMKNLHYEYYCLCDEIGKEGTPHTHLFFYCKNAVSFNRVKTLFPSAHIDKALGTCQENRDYIRKEGKYLDSDKKETNLLDTFEEYGILPLVNVDKNITVSEDVYTMIKEGATDKEIIEKHPSFITKTQHLDRIRNMLLEEEYSDTFRKLDCILIYGETASGKTSYVMNNHGFRNVYRVTNYRNPFDRYKGQPILLFDEFDNQIDITEMNNYLDGYPIPLPARYGDKSACFEVVYIITNLNPIDLYSNKPVSQRRAFFRRLTEVLHFTKNPADIKNPFIVAESRDDFLTGGVDIV